MRPVRLQTKTEKLYRIIAGLFRSALKMFIEVTPAVFHLFVVLAAPTGRRTSYGASHGKCFSQEALRANHFPHLSGWPGRLQ